jgi:hypothetical protein
LQLRPSLPLPNVVEAAMEVAVADFTAEAGEAFTEAGALEAGDITGEVDSGIAAAVLQIAAGDLRGDTAAVMQTAGAGMEATEERRQRVTRAAEAQTERAEIRAGRGITRLERIAGTAQRELAAPPAT